MEAAHRLRSLVDLVQDDPQDVRRQASAALTDTSDPHIVALANWALGLAARELHDLDQANDRLREAAATARAAHLVQLEGEILSSHALVLAYRGEVGLALATLDRADDLLEGGAAARNQMQRALILTRLGRLSEALDIYEHALPVMRANDDEMGEARLLLNRSVVLIWQGANREAIDDLERALDIARRRGQQLQIAACAQNLGFVRGRMGDVPAALELFAEAETAYRALGDSGRLATTLKDRSEVLASVGLVGDALADVEAAVAMLEESENVLDAAEARLTAARLAALAADPRRALLEASIAGRAFEVQERPDWVLQADLVAYDATVELGQGTAGHGSRLAAELDRRGWAMEAQDARLSAAKAGIRQGETDAAMWLLDAAAAASTSAVQRVQAHQARAVAMATAGQTAEARAEIARGLDEVDRQRATLGSIELRARAAARARDLIRLGLQIAVDTGDPLDVLATIESWRAASLRFPAVRPPDDDRLAEDLAKIRGLDAEMREARGQGLPIDEIMARRAELESRVRQRSLASRGSGAGDGHDAVEEVVRALDDSRLVAFFVDRGRLGSVVADRDGAELHDHGDASEIGSLTDSVVFMLQRMASGASRTGRGGRSAASVGAASAAFEDGVARLSSLLLPSEPRETIVVPSGVLHRLPWQALAGQQTVTVVPSVGSWSRVRQRWRPVSDDSRTMLVAGPELPGANDEVRGLAGRWRHSQALLGKDATVARVLAEMASADVAHLAAHGQFRADNPLFSSLRLDDGPLTVYDLERAERVPSTVVVPSCDIAVSEVSGGDELLGFTAALLALGVTGVVAPVVPIPDQATAPVMLDLHDGLRSGLPVGHALSRAVAATDESDIEQRAVKAAFLAFGV